MRCDFLRPILFLSSYCFNPHTYMRCDNSSRIGSVRSVVSIHTPTWGVTPWGDGLDGRSLVSIHTPTWGVTMQAVSGEGIMLFQSTHLHEVWLSPSSLISIIPLFQSTHLHEVWLQVIADASDIDRFNPHTYMRCDVRKQAKGGGNGCFNPHTYMRCDHIFMPIPVRLLCFNPHTYMRCDLFSTSYLLFNTMFQSTHLHEVWLPCEHGAITYVMFQSTHLHEVWP